MNASALNWFEIPVDNLSRAAMFYETVLNQALEHKSMGCEEMAVFQHERSAGTGGCLVKSGTLKPTDQGSIVYLNAGKDLDGALERVWNGGGRVALPKTALPGDMGYYAHIIDSEGNRVGLHAYP
jgi:uncharacterized protein